jgi:small subunit ribosomal protein S4
MSRYIGPLWRKSRALGISLLENKKEFSRGKKRTTIPGQHGNNTRRRRASAYSLQNKEKQKIRFLYGLRERQLRNLFIKLKNKKGELSYNLLLALESRLDNVVFRAGLGTRRFARQLVNHGHFLVNGEKVDIPSYLIKIGDVIELSEKIFNNDKIKYFLEKKTEVPAYIDFNREKMTVAFARTPLFEEITNSDISIPLIIE